jgi:ATP-binding protein involved in chromosome partitioning
VAGALEARVAAALAALRNPRLDNDLLSAGMIRDLTVTDDGAVSFTFLLAPEDPATLVRQARAAVQGVDGVERDKVRITVTNPAGPAPATHGPPSTLAPPSLPRPANSPTWAGCSPSPRARGEWGSPPWR